ncbi:hypothetical protein [Streptomyces sp. SAI-090]|uniref:hypothetical protein n=1 Tax=Streptomyces sp. SAI-090 TaxID=2940545 RepID=UPI00247322A8|nr:hypothetical protein [Streptomyces sp. SAI-090]MDH6522071.1 hypothetical protein [Streptomyces sp. SAI-090]
MELAADDVPVVRQLAVEMLRSTARGDHRVASRIGSGLIARFGTGGIAIAMTVWAEEIADHAPAAVRDAFGKPQPDKALTPEAEAAAATRVHQGYGDSSALGIPVPADPEMPDPATLHGPLARYISAVQRQDADDMRTALRSLDGNPQTAGDLLRELLLVMAADCSPLARS